VTSAYISYWRTILNNKELHAMMADYMDKGFLENIMDMLKHDRSLFSVLPAMISDERMGVRIGVVALAEAMREKYPEELRAQIPAVAAHMDNENPTIRGDAVYLLSAIAHPDALPFLEGHEDNHPGVQEMIEDTIEELKNPNG
jgi:hypothetical protein